MSFRLFLRSGVCRLRESTDRDSEDLTWSFEPPVLLGVLALGAIYLYGWRRARTPDEPHPPGYGRLALFAAGLVTILVALVSPLDSLGDQLMVMHMVQHILLLDVAPILLMLGLTKVLLRPATRRLNTIERRAGFLAHPAFAVIAYAGLMWLWHLPAMYDRALGNWFLHALEHLCFFTAGLLYWWHLSPRSAAAIGWAAWARSRTWPARSCSSASLGSRSPSPHPIYRFYAHQPHYWGLTPVQDQSLAGLTMALEQSIVMGIALVYLFVQMLVESEREAQRAERFEVAEVEERRRNGVQRRVRVADAAPD